MLSLALALRAVQFKGSKIKLLLCGKRYHYLPVRVQAVVRAKALFLAFNSLPLLYHSISLSSHIEFLFLFRVSGLVWELSIQRLLSQVVESLKWLKAFYLKREVQSEKYFKSSFVHGGFRQSKQALCLRGAVEVQRETTFRCGFGTRSSTMEEGGVTIPARYGDRCFQTQAPSHPSAFSPPGHSAKHPSSPPSYRDPHLLNLLSNLFRKRLMQALFLQV